jgi:hypothetical protein
MKSSCVNNEIKSFNRKLMENVRAYQHASILEVSTDRKLFTTHGLHLNGLGKEMLSKQIVSLTYAILDQKKDPLILLRWDSDASHTTSPQKDSITNQQTLMDMEVPTATPPSDEGTRMSKPPVLLCWNSDASHTTSPQEDSITNQQTLVHMEVPTANPSSDEGTRMSKREKKPPTTKSEDFLW